MSAAARAYCRLSVILRDSTSTVVDRWLRATLHGQLQLRFLRRPRADHCVLGINSDSTHRRVLAAMVGTLDAHPDVQALRWEMVPIRSAAH